ncbi:dUTP diphosphatase [Patulibacter sp.]|uniref:dUTP diphosphatase n=1 Tax=Patulibacter sp. TaxID=1912859 RepID=UPI00271F1A5B|nr:dUTP diphosphatase [Patulibacter sp.]MDO9407045.1 dUTP diphosphatase [Patulibacter sp.]
MPTPPAVPPLAVRRLRPDATLPVRQHPGDAGLDLCCVDPVVLGPGERALVPTGIAIAVPDGYAGVVTPRSGLAVRHGLTLVNTPGVVDAGYRGELRVLLLNTDREATFEAAAGERIAQLLLVPVALPGVVEVDALDDTPRGVGGFGSTGR